MAGRRTLDTKRWSWRRNSTQITIWRGGDASRWLMHCVWPSGKSKSGSRTGGWSWRRRSRPSKNWTNKKNKLRRKRQLRPRPATNEEAFASPWRLAASFSSKLLSSCEYSLLLLRLEPYSTLNYFRLAYSLSSPTHSRPSWSAALNHHLHSINLIVFFTCHHVVSASVVAIDCNRQDNQQGGEREWWMEESDEGEMGREPKLFRTKYNCNSYLNTTTTRRTRTTPSVNNIIIIMWSPVKCTPAID